MTLHCTVTHVLQNILLLLRGLVVDRVPREGQQSLGQDKAEGWAKS